MSIEILSRPPQGPVQGPPLLFVHGVCHAAWCWEPFLDFFSARGHAAHALSLRGHGGSSGRERLAGLRGYRLADYVDDVRRVADALPEPPILVGHSMGGGVVQKFLETLHVPGAVLLAAIPPEGVFRTFLRVLRHQPLNALLSVLRGRILPLFATVERCRDALFSAAMDDADVRRHLDRLQEESFRAFLDMLVLDRPRPARVARVPLLVLGAENDRLFSPDQIHDTARHYGTTATILPGLAHDLMLDLLWPRAAEAILQWLRQHFPYSSASSATQGHDDAAV